MNTSHRALEDERARILSRVRALTKLMDNAIRIPIINYRVGLDPIIGLIPGAGDTVGLAISAFMIWQAKRLGVSSAVLKRMVANVAFDWLVGLVPVLGDLSDVVFKANARNLRLLENAKLEMPSIVVKPIEVTAK